MSMIEWLYESLFVEECVCCGKEKFSLCPKCFKGIELNTELFCPVCLKNNGTGEFCKKCKKEDNSFLDGCWFVSFYKDENLQKAIHALKYDYVKVLGYSLGTLVKNFLRKINNDVGKEFSLKNDNNFYTVVPLHKKRFLERGFNQSNVILIETAKFLDLYYEENLLKRVKYTQPQVSLNGKERKKNLINAFECTERLDKYDVVFIFDDVYTTGSTLNECAKALKKAGAKKVFGLILAKD